MGAEAVVSVELNSHECVPDGPTRVAAADTALVGNRGHLDRPHVWQTRRTDCCPRRCWRTGR
jgi:hypothetical protein